jgi:hypothetical protein
MSKLRVSVLSTSATPATFQEGEILRKDQRLSFWLAQGANRRGPVTPSVVLVARLFTRGGALVSIIAEKFWADPTQINPWPASQNLGAFCGQIAPMVSVLPVVPVRKYCAVYYLAHDSYHGMEEVIGSIPIRSTK